MPQMSKEERVVVVVEKFFERKSYIAAQAAFRKKFNKAPIQQNVSKYCLHGTSLNKNKVLEDSALLVLKKTLN